MVLLMDDHRKTKRELIEEIKELRRSSTKSSSSNSEAEQAGANIEKFTKAFFPHSVPMDIREISDLLKTEKFLRESEKRFRTLIEHAPVPLCQCK
jgi:PAS domain-containing protein